MDLTRLAAVLPPSLHPQLDVLHRRFVARNPDGDINDFVAALHTDDHINADQLREILTSLDVTLTLSEGISAFQAAPAAHRLLGLLGKGAMGEVFIGRDRRLRRNVAVKRMDARLSRDPVLMTRFANEVQITAQLDHPSIIPIYGLEPQDDGTLAYSMKLIRGSTLKQRLQAARALVASGKRPPADFLLPARLDLFLQVCNAMAHAHARGVIHRDLKPDNIMVGAFSEVIVMDWGVARLVGGREPMPENGITTDRAGQTQTGLVIGTPRYMSPEQSAGRHNELTGHTDQYALGLILFELVSLRVARSGKEARRVLARAARGEKDPLVPLDPRDRVPRELAAVIHKATLIEPTRRYVDVAALAEDVRRYLRDDAVLAEPDSPNQRLARWVSHNRQLTLVLGLGLALLVVGTAALGIAAALGVRELSRRTAAKREERLALVLNTTNTHAQRMESRLLRFEGQLQGLAAAAEARLTDPAVPRAYYLAPSFFLPGKGPADLLPSIFYDTRVSFDAPDFVVGPGVQPGAVESRIFQLAALIPEFQQLHVGSGDLSTLSTADQRTDMRANGAAIVWSYVATEEGLLAGYPGCGVYPEGYDPRTQHWYVTGRTARVPIWEPAYIDESGMGLLVTCTRALHDRSGAFIGVAALDITVGYVIDTFLQPEGLPAPVEGWIVDSEGRVVVRSTLRVPAKGLKDYLPPLFPEAEVVTAMQGAAAGGGHLERDGTLFVWSALETLGWMYVITGDSGALLEPSG